MSNNEENMPDRTKTRDFLKYCVKDVTIVINGQPMEIHKVNINTTIYRDEADKTQENIKALKNSLTRFNIKGVCDEDRAYLQMAHGFSDAEIDSLFETYKKQLCNKIYDYGKEDRKKWHRS